MSLERAVRQVLDEPDPEIQAAVVLLVERASYLLEEEALADIVVTELVLNAISPDGHPEGIGS